MSKFKLKRNILTILTALLCCVFTAFGFACKKDEKEEFSLAPNAITLQVGQTQVLEVSGADKTQVVFASSNPLIATVDSSGVIKAESVGECKIQATYGEEFAICDIIVELSEEGGNVPYPVLTLSQMQAEILKGGALNISAMLSLDGETITPESIEWRSLNTSIATVSGAGVNATINGVAYGQTEVCVTAIYQEKTLVKNIVVSVKADASIELDKTEITVYLAEVSAGQKKTETITLLDASIDGVAYDGAYRIEQEESQTVASLNFTNNTLSVTAVCEGEETIRVGYYIPETEIFVYCNVKVTVKKGQGKLNTLYRFDVFKNETNECVIANSTSELSLQGEYVGLFTENGEQINTGNKLAFLYTDVQTYIDGKNLFSFTVKTDVAEYTAQAEITDRTNWEKISTYDQLNALRAKATVENGYTISGKYYLTGDIDCNNQAFSKIEANLGGTIDGNGYSIKNFSLKSPSGWQESFLISSIYGGGKLKNICFDGFQASVADGTSMIKFGSIVKVNWGVIENVVVRFDGNVWLGFKGIANKNCGTIENCIVDTTEMNVYKGEMKTKNSVSAFMSANNTIDSIGTGLVNNCYAYSLAEINYLDDTNNNYEQYGLTGGSSAINSAWYATETNNYGATVAETQTAFADALLLQVNVGKLSVTAYNLYLACVAQ